MKDFILRSSWSGMDKLAFFVGALLLLINLFGVQIGKIEGKLLPVVSGFHLEEINGNAISSKVSGRFDLVRPNCSFVQLSWVLVGASRSVPLDITFLPGPKVRTGGANAFGPWMVNIPVDKLKHTKAVAIHQCPWRPWQTVTHLYP